MKTHAEPHAPIGQWCSSSAPTCDFVHPSSSATLLWCSRTCLLSNDGVYTRTASSTETVSSCSQSSQELFSRSSSFAPSSDTRPLLLSGRPIGLSTHRIHSSLSAAMPTKYLSASLSPETRSQRTRAKHDTSCSLRREPLDTISSTSALMSSMSRISSLTSKRASSD